MPGVGRGLGRRGVARHFDDRRAEGWCRKRGEAFAFWTGADPVRRKGTCGAPMHSFRSFDESGADGGTRTPDPRITKHWVCVLVRAHDLLTY